MTNTLRVHVTHRRPCRRRRVWGLGKCWQGQLGRGPGVPGRRQKVSVKQSVPLISGTLHPKWRGDCCCRVQLTLLLMNLQGLPLPGHRVQEMHPRVGISSLHTCYKLPTHLFSGFRHTYLLPLVHLTVCVSQHLPWSGSWKPSAPSHPPLFSGCHPQCHTPEQGTTTSPFYSQG